MLSESNYSCFFNASFLLFLLDYEESATNSEETSIEESEGETSTADGEEHVIHGEAGKTNSGVSRDMSQRVESAKVLVAAAKTKQKEDFDHVLPDPRSIRYAHQVASCFIEGKIGEEMVRHSKTFLMPDGTSRSKVGKMGGCVVHIKGKVRALKLQKMGVDNRENWADTIVHKLERLATASNLSVKEIYEAVCGIVSDASSVNKGLASEISSKLGMEWIPNQLYCCIHTVLGWQDGMVKTWLTYQEKIGYDKMYPSVTGFELDMEDKCLIKQILECFLRLTADRWQARSWNRFEAFTSFCKDQGKVNMGRELHGNRFGDLERCCAIGIYHLDSWIEFINTRDEVKFNFPHIIMMVIMKISLVCFYHNSRFMTAFLS